MAELGAVLLLATSQSLFNVSLEIRGLGCEPYGLGIGSLTKCLGGDVLTRYDNIPVDLSGEGVKSLVQARRFRCQHDFVRFESCAIIKAF